MERKKRSKVWLYFTKRDEYAAVCNQCKTVISCKGANTSNMQKHLSTKHGVKLQECHVFDRLQTGATATAAASVAERRTSSSGQNDGNVHIKYPALARCCFINASSIHSLL